VLLAVIGFVATVTPALSPAAAAHYSLLAPAIPASLSYNGAEPVITGSVRKLFETATFVGPNRAEKRNRALPRNDAVLVASAFDKIRKQLAAARPRPKLAPAPDLRDLLMTRDDPADSPQIGVASIDPGLLSAALVAIEKASPAPEPMKMTQKLAYARADTPATVFDTPASMRVSEKQFQCLATAVYFEARGESYRGQAAVAQVVLNRVKHRLYPNTICAVVYQNQHSRNACQFSFACDGIPERITEPDAWAKAKEIASRVLRGEIYLPEVGDATHYHANYVRPRWALHMKKVTQIGMHIFYRFRNT